MEEAVGMKGPFPGGAITPLFLSLLERSSADEELKGYLRLSGVDVLTFEGWGIYDDDDCKTVEMPKGFRLLGFALDGQGGFFGLMFGGPESANLREIRLDNLPVAWFPLDGVGGVLAKNMSEFWSLVPAFRGGDGSIELALLSNSCTIFDFSAKLVEEEVEKDPLAQPSGKPEGRAAFVKFLHDNGLEVIKKPLSTIFAARQAYAQSNAILQRKPFEESAVASGSAGKEAAEEEQKQ